jgi:hypothetical protein
MLSYEPVMHPPETEPGRSAFSAEPLLTAGLVTGEDVRSRALAEPFLAPQLKCPLRLRDKLRFLLVGKVLKASHCLVVLGVHGLLSHRISSVLFGGGSSPPPASGVDEQRHS